MNATAMRPVSPAVTSGKTVLVTPGGLICALGVQKVPGTPPAAGLLRASSIGETLKNRLPWLTQTM